LVYTLDLSDDDPDFLKKKTSSCPNNFHLENFIENHHQCLDIPSDSSEQKSGETKIRDFPYPVSGTRPGSLSEVHHFLSDP